MANRRSKASRSKAAKKGWAKRRRKGTKHRKVARKSRKRARRHGRR